MKHAIPYYFEQLRIDDPNVKVNIVQDVDKQNLTVGLVIKVSLNNGPGYTLSIYYTSCSFLLNGKNTPVYDHRPAEHKSCYERSRFEWE